MDEEWGMPVSQPWYITAVFIPLSLLATVYLAVDITCERISNKLRGVKQ